MEEDETLRAVAVWIPDGHEETWIVTAVSKSGFKRSWLCLSIKEALAQAKVLMVENKKCKEIIDGREAAIE